MKRLFVMSAAFAVFALTAAAQETRSAWSGVYTAAQAERGKVLFTENCARCHGDNLAGIEMAPALSGSSFLSNWNGENVANLVDRIRTTMPADDPGKLSRVSATDLTAFIFSSNAMPAGEFELARDQPLQAGIRIDALKPN